MTGGGAASNAATPDPMHASISDPFQHNVQVGETVVSILRHSRPAWAAQPCSGRTASPPCAPVHAAQHAQKRAAGAQPRSHGSRLSVLHFNDVYNIECRKQEPVGGAAKFVSKVRELQQVCYCRSLHSADKPHRASMPRGCADAWLRALSTAQLNMPLTPEHATSTSCSSARGTACCVAASLRHAEARRADPVQRRCLQPERHVHVHQGGPDASRPERLRRALRRRRQPRSRLWCAPQACEFRVCLQDACAGNGAAVSPSHGRAMSSVIWCAYAETSQSRSKDPRRRSCWCVRRWQRPVCCRKSAVGGADQ